MTSKYIAGTSIQSSQQDIWSSQGIKALPRCKTPLSTCPPTPSTLRPDCLGGYIGPQQCMYGRFGQRWYMGAMSGHVSCRPMAAPFLAHTLLLGTVQSTAILAGVDLVQCSKYCTALQCLAAASAAQLSNCSEWGVTRMDSAVSQHPIRREGGGVYGRSCPSSSSFGIISTFLAIMSTFLDIAITLIVITKSPLPLLSSPS